MAEELRLLNVGVGRTWTRSPWSGPEPELLQHAWSLAYYVFSLLGLASSGHCVSPTFDRLSDFDHLHSVHVCMSMCSCQPRTNQTYFDWLRVGDGVELNRMFAFLIRLLASLECKEAVLSLPSDIERSAAASCVINARDPETRGKAGREYSNLFEGEGRVR